ncbi:MULTISPECIES: hypothetical protein, partial [Paraburkholderia]
SSARLLMNRGARQRQSAAIKGHPATAIERPKNFRLTAIQEWSVTMRLRREVDLMSDFRLG